MFEIASLKEGMMHGVELFQLLLEIISIACVVIGLGKTLWLAARVRDHEPGFPRIRLCFGSWLILALEFQLAADILATTIAPDEFLDQLEAEHRIKPEVREARGMGFVH